MKSILIIFLLSTSITLAQRVAFMSSEIIRARFPEGKRAEQRIQSSVEQWNREMENFQIKIDNIELEIKQNKLIWTDQELKDKNAQLSMIVREKNSFAKRHFETGGEYDKLVKTVWAPIEDKIFAATSEVAAEQGFDFVFDKSLQPIPYANYKYDLTLKIMEKLGLDVSDLKDELNKKIEADPRNQQKESRTPDSQRGRENGRSRSRSRTDSRDSQELQPVPTDLKPEGLVPPSGDPTELPTEPSPDGNDDKKKEPETEDPNKKK